MIKDKELKLKEKLKHILSEVAQNKEIKQTIAIEFKNRNMGALKPMWILMGNLDIDTFANSEEDIRFLFVFSIALEKALQHNTEIKFDAREYFTDAEYLNWINYVEEDEEEKTTYPIIVENVQKIAEGHWQTVISAKQLNSWDINNLLVYNFKTQRNPKITVGGEKINVDKIKVKEIKERMLNGEQYADSIKLNILHNGEDNIEYDERNQRLIINAGEIDIFDGYHRTTANTLALESFENLQFNWSVVFTNFSESKANDYMMQINKQKPIKKEFARGKDYSKPENLLVDVIADDKLSLLAKVMKDDDAYIKNNRALTKKSIIALAIAEQYGEQIKVTSNIRSIARWIVEITDYIMSLYSEEFLNNPYEIKKTSVINDKRMFLGYIALSKDIQNKVNWQQIIKEKMASIDFSRENPLWRDFGITNTVKDANKTTRDKIYKLFTKGK